MRIGIFGGTFDPLHLGHIEISNAALQQLNLDRILFIPCKLPVIKAQPTASAQVRLEILQKLADDCDKLSIESIEIERTTPSYTIHTIQTVAEKYDLRPMEMFLIIGADAAADMAKWHRISELSQMCQLLIYPRPTTSPRSVERCVTQCGWKFVQTHLKDKVTSIQNTNQAIWLQGDVFDISSTQIRQLLNKDVETASQYLHSSTINYLKRSNIYTNKPCRI